jgi:hypothetical protein
MAYRRPAIQVIQQFQSAAAALALPTLPACIVGPGFQIADNVNAGHWAGVQATFAYVGQNPTSTVDTSAAPTDAADLGVYKGVGVALKNAYVRRVPATAPNPTTGQLKTPNVFYDATANAFAAFDPTAAGAPQFYVDVLAGAGVAAADLGRKLVTGKTDNNNLVVAAEWQSGGLPVAGVTYRILELRLSETIPAASFGASGVTVTSSGVTVSANLLTATDATPLQVAECDIYLAWRAIRNDLAGALNAFTDNDSIVAIFGAGAIVPANLGAYALSLALQNTTTSVSFSGVTDDWYANEEIAFQSAFQFLSSKDVYALAILSQNSVVHQDANTHVNGMSDPAIGRERICFVNQQLQTRSQIFPATGTRTSAGGSNGLSGANNKTFKDPTNGTFVSSGVRPGYFLEVTAYVPVTGTNRTVTADEEDFLFSGAPNVIRLGHGVFTAGDVGKTILVRGATTAGNNKEYTISAITSAVKAQVTQAPAAEVLPSTARTWIASLDRAIAHNAADAVVAATKTWSFVNGAFTVADVGKLIFMAGAANAGNNGVFTVANVLSATQITTVEAPGADEAFGVGVTEKAYTIVREPVRDAVYDSVVGASRVWMVQNGNFTADDIGRTLRVAGAQQAGNNADHIIEAVLASNSVRTSNATTPVTENFTGLVSSITITIVETATSATEDAALKTRHLISAVVSETQLTLASDPAAGYGGTFNSVVYKITRDLTRDEQAAVLAGYATSLGSRRVVSTWPDHLVVSVGGTTVIVPGYFAGAALAAMCAGLPSQAPLTNLSIAGFVGREHSDDYFSDTQLDVIAGGGNLILTQPTEGAALGVRHQLTTDVSTIYFQELSVTKNVDAISRFFRGLFAPLVGVYNITDPVIDIIKTRGEGGITFLISKRVQRIGAPLKKGAIQSITSPESQPDSLAVGIGIDVPLPLNNLTITLFV